MTKRQRGSKQWLGADSRGAALPPTIAGSSQLDLIIHAGQAQSCALCHIIINKRAFVQKNK